MPSGVFGVSNNSQGLHTQITWWTADDAGNNRTRVYAKLQARRDSATTFGNGSWTLYVNGSGQTTNAYRSVGTGWVDICEHNWLVGHNSDGRKQITISVSGGIGGTSWSSTSGSSSPWLTDYSRPPGTMSAPTISEIGPTSAKISWSAPSSAVSISDYDLHVCTDDVHSSSVCQAHYSWTGNSSRSKTLTNLDPGTKYYAALRARSSEGTGGWSAWKSFETLGGGRRKVAGVWRNVLRWRKVNGQWKKVRRWKKVSGVWKPTR